MLVRDCPQTGHLDVMEAQQLWAIPPSSLQVLLASRCLRQLTCQRSIVILL